jgi:hypothetical protein
MIGKWPHSLAWTWKGISYYVRPQVLETFIQDQCPLDVEGEKR